MNDSQKLCELKCKQSSFLATVTENRIFKQQVVKQIAALQKALAFIRRELVLALAKRVLGNIVHKCEVVYTPRPAGSPSKSVRLYNRTSAILRISNLGLCVLS